MVEWKGVGEINPDIHEEWFVPPRVFRFREEWAKVVGHVDTSASHPDSWDFLADLVRATHVRCIVEAGTYRGHGTLAMAESLRLDHRTDAHIWTADVEDFGIQQVLDKMDLHHLVTFFHGRFEAMLERVNLPIDVAFIDASEVARPMLRLEYVNMVMPRLAPHGIVVVDDSTNDEWPGAKLLRQHANLYLPIGHGLTLFQGFRE